MLNKAFEKVESVDPKPLARFALFAIYFWFGAVKLIGLSQASPLAQALTTNTIGARFFGVADRKSVV